MGFDFNKVISDAVKSLGALGEEIKPKLEGLGDKFQEHFGDDMDAAKESLTKVAQELMGSKEADVDPSEVVSKVLGTKDIPDAIEAKANEAATKIGNATEKVEEKAAAAAEKAEEKAAAAVETVEAKANEAGEKANDMFENLVDALKEKADGLGDMLGDALKGVGEKVEAAVKDGSALDKIKDLFDGDNKDESAK